MTVSSHVTKKCTGLSLADPNFWQPGPVDFLLDSDLFVDILPAKPLPPISGKSGAIQTILGLVVMGPCSSIPSPQYVKTFMTTMNDTDERMQRFWEVEEPSMKKRENPKDNVCEEFFKQTHTRDPFGRYVVGLPFESGGAAGVLTRFNKIEAKMQNDQSLRAKYYSFMEEYLELGHMQL